MSCERQGKWIGGCKFKPRFDVVGPVQIDIWAFLSIPGHATPRATPARQTYICDVCERCGKTLVRRKGQPQ